MTDGIATLRAGPTERWRGLLGGTLLAAAAGLVTGSAGLVLLAGVGTALLAYGRVVTPPPATLSVERDCTPADPDRDEPVTVELTVTNVGERTLSDVRVVDGVPDGLTVTDATPAVGTALRPGGSVTVTYEIRGSRPRYRFEPVTVVLRDVAGVVERRVECPVDDEIGWATGEATVPLAPKQSLVPGPLPVEDGGDGGALHAVREYQPRARDELRVRAASPRIFRVSDGHGRLAAGEDDCGGFHRIPGRRDLLGDGGEREALFTGLPADGRGLHHGQVSR